MKLIFKGLITVFFLIVISSFSMATELSGTVVKVSNLDVTVRVDGDLMPVKGDTMEISFTLPDGEQLSIGTWIITRVTGSMAVATVKDNTGNPVVGHRAVIFSENPLSLTDNRKEDTVTTFPNTGMTADPSSEIEQVISQLRSTNPVQKRDGSKIAFRRFAGNASVAAVAAEELEKGYLINHRDRYHVDAMAWLCNILGASYDKKYAPLLKKVYKESRSDKISDYAKKNYKLLK